MHHENFMIINCPELINIKCRLSSNRFHHSVKSFGRSIKFRYPVFYSKQVEIGFQKLYNLQRSTLPNSIASYERLNRIYYCDIPVCQFD